MLGVIFDSSFPHIPHSIQQQMLHLQNTSQTLTTSHDLHIYHSVPPSSLPPSSPAWIIYRSLLNWSPCSAPALLLLQSSLNPAARTILFQQESGCIIPLFQIPVWLSTGLQGPAWGSLSPDPQPHHLPLFLLSTVREAVCCFSNQISTLPSHGLRHAVSSALNTFLRELNSEIPHFLQESVQMPIYQWSFPWPPYIKQQCPQDPHPLYPTLFCHHLIYIYWFICTLPVSQTRNKLHAGKDFFCFCYLLYYRAYHSAWNVGSTL